MRLAFVGMGVVVLIVVLLLATNIARHAISPQSTTKVDVSVESVVPRDASRVVITATLRSQAKGLASVTCLVGVARPAMPLAFPTRVTEHLSPGVDRQITIERTLVKPVAATVRTSDVALTCT